MAVMGHAIDDGDAAFIGVDTRTAAHMLPPGMAADGVNTRFGEPGGAAGPRFREAYQGWGEVGLNLAPNFWPSIADEYCEADVTLTVGMQYFYVPGNTLLYTGFVSTRLGEEPAGNQLAPGLFTATQG